MTSEMIKKDSRLLLFQALEYGFKEKLLNDTSLNKLKKEGSQMSFAFAKKYYNVIYEAYLRHASHCVLGVINIGLIVSSNNQLDSAIILLRQKSYVDIFREGWARVLKLVQYAITSDSNNHKTAFEWEKEFAESFSAEPGRQWIGYDEYLINIQIYCSHNRGTNETN